VSEVGPEKKLKVNSISLNKKSILIVEEHNKEKAEAYFKDSDWKVVTGCRHLGAFIGDKAEQREWVEEKAQTWADGVLELSKVVGRHPQAAHAGLQKSLQQEWQFLQRVTNGLSDEFTTYLRIGLLRFSCKFYYESFREGFSFSSEQSVHREHERCEMTAILQAGPEIFPFLLFFL
jgi:hypothetical protein